MRRPAVRAPWGLRILLPLLLGLLAAGTSVPLAAQGPPDTAAARPNEAEPRLRPQERTDALASRYEDAPTLALWAEELWLAVLDRDGSFRGRFAEEGVFQRFNPAMDREYDLDVRTGLFTPAEDGRWSGRGSGLRMAVASVSHPHLLNAIDWRQEVPVTEEVHLLARYHREHSLTARRDYVRAGVRWRNALGSAWTAGADVGVHFEKPSADVELTLARTWGPVGEASGSGAAGAAAPGGDARGSGGERIPVEDARWRLEVGVAALDAFSDLVFQGLGVREEDVEAHVDHRAVPWAVRTTLRRTAPGWRGELHGGVTGRSEAAVTFPASGRAAFSQAERVAFAGALVEVDLAPRVAVAGWATLARADTDRRSAGPGFALREETVRAGIRPRIRLGEELGLVAEVERVWRPEERTLRPASGPEELLDHRDRTTFGRIALLRRPVVGWTGRLAWTVLDRSAGVIVPELTARNQRLVTAWGWRFATGFEVTAGLRWDLDALGEATFDGGHVRFSGRW